jgi:hypothetical protein
MATSSLTRRCLSREPDRGAFGVKCSRFRNPVVLPDFGTDYREIVDEDSAECLCLQCSRK